jgi:hypothetical protein
VMLKGWHCCVISVCHSGRRRNVDQAASSLGQTWEDNSWRGLR